MPARFAFSLTLLVVGLVTGPADAIFVPVEIKKVPVNRIIQNLNETIAKEPKNVTAMINLARAHAMAYTLRSEEVPTARSETNIWFGYEPKLVPFGTPAKTDDANRLKVAKAHLEKAIELYKKAVALDPKNLPARLGLAWTLDQSGRKADAVTAYRKLIEDAWAKEKELKALGLGGHTVTGEAAEYLIPLLDKDKDKDEITTLKERADKLRKLPRPITPIAVPLRAGLRAADLEQRSAAVAFDADGTGLKKQWTWITPEAAWLVHDPVGKGEITSALQMFGSVTFWMFWETGYDALAALDDDRDGMIRGEELRGLALWHDANSNGIAEPGEVKPLAAHGIVALSCRFERDPRHPDRIACSSAGAVFRDGTTRPTFDLVLHPAPRK